MHKGIKKLCYFTSPIPRCGSDTYNTLCSMQKKVLLNVLKNSSYIKTKTNIAETNRKVKHVGVTL